MKVVVGNIVEDEVGSIGFEVDSRVVVKSSKVEVDSRVVVKGS